MTGFYGKFSISCKSVISEGPVLKETSLTIFFSGLSVFGMEAVRGVFFVVLDFLTWNFKEVVFGMTLTFRLLLLI